MMRTPLCDLLGIEHPILLAGMGGVSYSEVAAAVSEAGGFGCLGAAGMQHDEMRREIAPSEGAHREALRRRPPHGEPARHGRRSSRPSAPRAHARSSPGSACRRKVVDLCHRHGVLVVNMCGKVEPRRCAPSRRDATSSSRRAPRPADTPGTIATMPLVPMIVDAVKVPVVAAGGIFDGRGLVAALALGAQGIWMGTRFIASDRGAGARASTSRSILDIDETGTLITRCYSGKTMRAIRTDYTDEWEVRKDELQPFPMQATRATQDGVWNTLVGPGAGLDPNRDCMPAGQSAGGIHDVRPCREIIDDIVAQASAIIAGLPAPTRKEARA